MFSPLFTYAVFAAFLFCHWALGSKYCFMILCSVFSRLLPMSSAFQVSFLLDRRWDQIASWKNWCLLCFWPNFAGLPLTTLIRGIEVLHLSSLRVTVPWCLAASARRWAVAWAMKAVMSNLFSHETFRSSWPTMRCWLTSRRILYDSADHHSHTRGRISNKQRKGPLRTSARGSILFHLPCLKETPRILCPKLEL